jgi:hypothetical protein
MSEPVDIKKALDLSPTALVKSTSATFKGLLGLSIIAGAGLLLWMGYVTFIKPHTSPKPTTLTTITNPGNGTISVDQDCSQQVCSAIEGRDRYWDLKAKNSKGWIHFGVKWLGDLELIKPGS